MSYSVEFTQAGLSDLEKLTPTIRERIFRKIRWLADNFEQTDPLALSADLSGLFKLRVGDYRVIYSTNAKLNVLTIHKIGHRRDVYRL